MKLELPQVISPEAFRGWKNHFQRWDRCGRCLIGSIAIEHVFFRGEIPCDVLFIGEAPGKTEDATKVPFVGKSGKLLDEWIIDASMTYTKANPVQAVFRWGTKIGDQPLSFRFAITNTVLCRPCDRRGGPNRPPTHVEKENCSDRLAEFLEIAKPKLIILVGRHAGNLKLSPEQRVERIMHPAAALYAGGRGSHVDLSQRSALRDIILKEAPLWLR